MSSNKSRPSPKAKMLQVVKIAEVAAVVTFEVRVDGQLAAEFMSATKATPPVHLHISDKGLAARAMFAGVMAIPPTVLSVSYAKPEEHDAGVARAKPEEKATPPAPTPAKSPAKPAANGKAPAPAGSASDEDGF